MDKIVTCDEAVFSNQTVAQMVFNHISFIKGCGVHLINPESNERKASNKSMTK